MEPKTPEQIKKLLSDYHDLPRRIDEEYAAAQHCYEQMEMISLPSVNLSGMPGGKGIPGNRTADEALGDNSGYFEREGRRCFSRAAELKALYNWCTVALDSLDRIDRRILELAYIGPKDAKERRRWSRRPPWKTIAAEVDYSESQVRARAASALFQLSALSAQTVLPDY